jgi:hypothetical protein
MKDRRYCSSEKEGKQNPIRIPEFLLKFIFSDTTMGVKTPRPQAR